MKKIQIIPLLCAILIAFSACGKTEQANETSPEAQGTDTADATDAISAESTQDSIQTEPETSISTDNKINKNLFIVLILSLLSVNRFLSMNT